jgi:hypothetical protein
MAVPAPREIAPGVWLVTIGRGVASANVYLVGSGSTWVLVDAGWANSAAAIRAAAEATSSTTAATCAVSCSGTRRRST